MTKIANENIRMYKNSLCKKISASFSTKFLSASPWIKKTRKPLTKYFLVNIYKGGVHLYLHIHFCYRLSIYNTLEQHATAAGACSTLL